jgi:hypothetical protein
MLSATLVGFSLPVSPVYFNKHNPALPLLPLFPDTQKKKKKMSFFKSVKFCIIKGNNAGIPRWRLEPAQRISTSR